MLPNRSAFPAQKHSSRIFEGHPLGGHTHRYPNGKAVHPVGDGHVDPRSQRLRQDPAADRRRCHRHASRPTIRELAEMVAGIVGFRGRLKFDTSKPDGTPRKMLDVSRANSLGWRAQIGLREEIVQTHRWFIETGAGSGQPDPVVIAQEKA